MESLQVCYSFLATQSTVQVADYKFLPTGSATAAYGAFCFQCIHSSWWNACLTIWWWWGCTLFFPINIKNYNLLFCCHFQCCLMLKMAAFQQLSSTMLLHPLATHRLAYFSSPTQATKMWAPTSFVSWGLIKCFIIIHCTAPSWEHQKWPPSVPQQQLESG